MRLIVLLVSVFLVTPVYAEVVEEKPSDVVLRTIENICIGIQMSRSSDTTTPKKLIEKYIANFHGKSKPDEKTLYNAELFWNKYHNHFICDLTATVPEGRKKLHITKMALQYSMFTPFFDDFLLEEDSEYEYNVNSVQWVDGKPETVIDYIDSILNNRAVHKYYNVKQIKFFKELLIEEYNAKTAKQLLAEKH